MDSEQPVQTSNNKGKLIAVLAVLVVIVVIVAAAAALKPKKKDDVSTADQTTHTATQPTTTDTNEAAQTASSYKDGSYTATGSYNSPGGVQSITITMALKDGTVTDTSAKSGANDPTAREYQNDFIGGYKSKVVGKKLDSLNLSRVSGSSLTSIGFKEALDKIKDQARG